MAETLSVGAGGRVAMIFEDTRQPLFELRPRQAASYVLANLANLARTRGDLERARELLDEAAARFDADGDDWGRGDVLTRRAYLELDAGAPEEAERCFASALELRRGLNDRRGVGLALGGLGWAAIARGELGEADVHLADARAIFRRAGDRWGLAGALWRTADLAFARGRPDEAEAALAEAREILAETGRSRWEAFTLSGLAEAAVLRGDAASAGELLREARARLAAKGDAVGAAAVDARLTALAKAALMERKGRRSTTSPTSTTTRRQT
jgi:tetratricopeptide (TPR) repeat protein